MEVIPKKYFLRTAKKYKKKHYDLSKVNKVVSLIEKENFEQLYTKHKLGVIHGTHPPLYHVHVDRAYNDDWLLFYFGDNNKIYLSALGNHNLIEHISKIFND
ncbi:type II toxin-antitoxin system YafQ family toxin [Lactobacillus crispatus]|uniref:type II toxin-antitoxin system YafQ family toxin n=1 Tax=Lactobacillus crispatus TaxID=47770 RepID=UPI000B5DA01D|nr:type II toxin-antitoxin system YafQ family toxin [Lactobacillus crispatus]OXC12862.1 hypothetical protein AYP78_09925 [Lactobacillus crispatus]OXC15674.1 hypothetical protein AYP79_09835 [Lactobacillus crispatus]OXC22065.1 hypothetical protein AYP80_04810 [Lactobacillus crispatus]